MKATARNPFLIAWVLGLLFYFLEYAVRSAPSIMIRELTEAFGTTTSGVSTIIGAYYITYSVTSLIAGLALDKAGVKYPLTAGTVILGAGCILFIASTYTAGYTGRLLQGMGSAIAFPACVYLAAKAFSPKNLASAIGITQSLGMLGGSAGQFVVAPLLRSQGDVFIFWVSMGIVSGIIGLFVLLTTPRDTVTVYTDEKQGWLTPYKIVFSNRQSYLCGIVSGLLFAPTTIFAMTWGVAFFETDRQLEYHTAAIACALVPLGWAVGCPILGWIADKLERRKPVIIAGSLIMMISFLQLIFLPSALHVYISMFILGIGSGAAMIPYSVIKEANPDKVKGSATGAINFVTFGVTSLLGPLFNLLNGKDLALTTTHEVHFREAGTFWIVCIALAIVVSLFLKETGKKPSTALLN
jgi:MFS family permease